MTVTDLPQGDIVEAFIGRLQKELKLSERQCYLVIEPDDVPNIPTGGHYFLTVAPMDGTFDIEEQAIEQCMERADIVVTILSRVALDQSKHDTKKMLDARRGLLPIKRLVLKAMVGSTLAESCDPLTVSPVRSLIYATRATAARMGQQGKHLLAYMQITFSTEFDWDLSS